MKKHLSPMHCSAFFRLLVAASAFVSASAIASPETFGIRQSSGDIWSEASRRSGVPVHVLHGIALVESGRLWSDGSVRPWPWTLNSPSTGGRFFSSRQKAESELRRLIAAGVTNIDIGPMQVNCGYHCSRVKDPADLLDPHTNIRVASDILAEYRALKGGLADTVGAYHAGLHPGRAERARWYQDSVAERVRRLRAGAGA